jgi:capsule polysaccharide export protein KpsE/RkpR
MTEPMRKADEASDDYLDFSDLIAILKKEIWVILAVMVLILSASLYKAMTDQPIFQASSKLLYQGGSQANAQMSALAQVAGINLGAKSKIEPPEYMPDLLEDQAFLQEILDRKWLVKGDSVTLEQVWKMHPDTTQPDWAYRYSQNRLSVLKDKRITVKTAENGLLILSTYFEDASLTFQINQHVVGMLDNYLISKMKSNAKESRQFIERQLKGAEETLSQSETDLANFMEQNVSFSSPKLLLRQKRLQRTVTVNQEMFIELKRQYELSRIEEHKSQPFLDVINQPIVPVFKSKPKRKQIIAAGLMGGLFLGIVFGFLHFWIMENRLASRRKKMSGLT